MYRHTRYREVHILSRGQLGRFLSMRRMATESGVLAAEAGTHSASAASSGDASTTAVMEAAALDVQNAYAHRLTHVPASAACESCAAARIRPVAASATVTRNRRRPTQRERRERRDRQREHQQRLREQNRLRAAENQEVQEPEQQGADNQESVISVPAAGPETERE